MYYSKYNKYKKKYLELCNLQNGGNNILLEYNSIKDEVTYKIKSLEVNIEFDFVPQLVNDLCNKNIFVLFNTVIDLQKFCNNLKENFFISEDIKIIKNEFTFLYKGFSIKFLKTETIPFTKFYLSYNEFGIILKIILKKYNLLLKKNNLSINKFNKNIILTNNPIFFCDFINIDRDVWERQIKTEEDIFMLIKTSRFYKKEIFTTPNYYFRKFKDNKILQNFFDYNKINLNCLIKKLNDNFDLEKKIEVIPIKKIINENNLAICFFNKQEEVLNAQKEDILTNERIERKSRISTIISKVFSDIKFKHKDKIFLIIKTLKEEYGMNYESWVINSSQEEINIKIDEIISKLNL
jgi:hypothetical protein